MLSGELREQYAALEAAGIAFYVVTAEPGDNADAVRRLAKRECADLPFTVIADPACATLPSGPEIFVREAIDAKKKFGPDTEYGDYDMVQPALIVADASLNLVNWWSWKSVLDYDPSAFSADTPVGLQIVKVPSSGESCRLVSLRPRIDNLADVLSGSAQIVVVDVAKNSKLGDRYKA